MKTFSVSYVMKVLRTLTMPAGFRDQIGLGWRKLHDPYRPERYYMRGPGPRSREKHLYGTSSRWPVPLGVGELFQSQYTTRFSNTLSKAQ